MKYLVHADVVFSREFLGAPAMLGCSCPRCKHKKVMSQQ